MLETTIVRGGGAKTLAKSSIQYPHFLWLDDRTIAYSVWDKYQIPHLYVGYIKTGRRRQVYASSQMGDLLPVGYWPPGKRLLVQMSPVPLVSRCCWETIWSVGMDGHAVKLATLYEEPKSPTRPQDGLPVPAMPNPKTGRPNK